MTLSNSEIVELVRHEFVCARVDADREEPLIGRYDVKDLPTLVFLSPQGQEVSRMPNDYTNRASKVLEFLDRARKLSARAVEAEKGLLARLAREPDSVEAQGALARWLQQGRRYEEARDRFHAASRRGGAGADALLAQAVWCDLKLRRFAQARAGAEELEKSYPASRERAMMVYYRGLCWWHGEKNARAAIQAWEEVVRAFPDSPWAPRARQMIARAMEQR